MDWRSHPGAHPDARRLARDQARQCGAIAGRGAKAGIIATNRSQRAASLPALSSLRLSSVLPALLLRTALLLSAVSLLRAGAIPVRFRIWTVVVIIARFRIADIRSGERRREG